MSDNQATAKILPEDTAQAIDTMISITEKVIESYENETNAVALGNDTVFLETTKDKMDMGTLYQKAANEFMEREQEFVSLGGTALQDLINLQHKLKAEAQINMNYLEQVENKARAAVEGVQK